MLLNLSKVYHLCGIKRRASTVWRRRQRKKASHNDSKWIENFPFKLNFCSGRSQQKFFFPQMREKKRFPSCEHINQILWILLCLSLLQKKKTFQLSTTGSADIFTTHIKLRRGKNKHHSDGRDEPTKQHKSKKMIDESTEMGWKSKNGASRNEKNGNEKAFKAVLRGSFITIYKKGRVYVSENEKKPRKKDEGWKSSHMRDLSTYMMMWWSGSREKKKKGRKASHTLHYKQFIYHYDAIR